MKNELISILMPVGDVDIKVLNKSLECIINQTYKEIELIIICDTENNAVRKTLKNFSKNKLKNSFIHFNKVNLGITKSLNIGLNYANGKFIARYDSDDLMNKNRIRNQSNFLRDHPKIDIIFTNYKIFFEKTIFSKKKKVPNNLSIIKWRMIFCNQFCHPSAMFRKKLVDDGLYKYNENYLVSQDYELWSKFILLNINFYILEDYLYFLRIHRKSVSISKKQLQNDNSVNIGYNYLSKNIQFTVSKSDYNDLIYILCFHKYDYKKNKIRITENFDNVLKVYLRIYKTLLIRKNQEISNYYFIEDMNKFISFIGLWKSYKLSILRHLRVLIFLKLQFNQLLKRLISI